SRRLARRPSACSPANRSPRRQRNDLGLRPPPQCLQLLDRRGPREGQWTPGLECDPFCAPIDPFPFGLVEDQCRPSSCIRFRIPSAGEREPAAVTFAPSVITPTSRIFAGQCVLERS